MANVEHSTLTGADLHEPKGVASALDKQVYVANGAASGSWQNFAMGSVFQDAISSPITITGSGAAQVRVSDILSGGAAGSTLLEMQANADNSLQYTGTWARHFHIACTVSAQRSAGTSSECVACLQHYDDSLGTWSIITHSYVAFEIAATPSSTAIHADIMMDTNDKIVLSFENTGGANDVALVTHYLFAMGMPGT